jgi:geranylgeranyl diphosphate synthase type II
MNLDYRIECALEKSLSAEALQGTPGRLIESLRYAVFPGGARVRPRLCLAVSMACGGNDSSLEDATAVAIELLHCASLVHDDMPCFDSAATRRGKPSVHLEFGEALALLTGDALIVRAFQVLNESCMANPGRLAQVFAVVSGGVGVPGGIVAGQAWECESEVPLADYQRAKTGALFAAATMGGAAAAGADAAPWRLLGETIGKAYQFADDILDSSGDPQLMGKPVGTDVALNRPSSVRELGQVDSAEQLRQLVRKAADYVPACPGEKALRTLIAAESEQFMHMALGRRAAA